MNNITQKNIVDKFTVNIEEIQPSVLTTTNLNTAISESAAKKYINNVNINGIFPSTEVTNTNGYEYLNSYPHDYYADNKYDTVTVQFSSLNDYKSDIFKTLLGYNYNDKLLFLLL